MGRPPPTDATPPYTEAPLSAVRPLPVRLRPPARTAADLVPTADPDTVPRCSRSSFRNEVPGTGNTATFHVPGDLGPESSQAGGQGPSTPDIERDELPVSSQLPDGTTAPNRSIVATDISGTVETYNKFKEEQELKLQEWLKESEKARDSKV